MGSIATAVDTAWRPHDSRCADRFGRVRAAAARSAGAKAGGRFEHNAENILFAAGERLADGLGWCTSGPADELPDFIASMPMRKYFVVDVPRIMRTMRERADAAGFDLTGGYIFPPTGQSRVCEIARRISAAARDGLEKIRPFASTAQERF